MSFLFAAARSPAARSSSAACCASSRCARRLALRAPPRVGLGLCRDGGAVEHEDRNRLVLEQQFDAVAAGLDDVVSRRHASGFFQHMVLTPVQPIRDIDGDPLVGVALVKKHASS